MLCEDFELSLFNALDPVSETAADTSEEGVGPEGFFDEERTHFDAELPESDGDAWSPNG